MRQHAWMSVAAGSWLAVSLAVSLAACAPRLSPLRGVTPANATLPTIGFLPGSRKIVFTWDLEQNSLVARGDGAARLAGPDSARVDLFLAGGFGGASAILIGERLILPPGTGSGMRDLVPQTPLLWAALGRLALPALSDTIIRMSGDTLRADIGHPRQWRVTAVGDTLLRLEHVSGGRVVESVERTPGGGVRYESSSHRSVVLHITYDQPTAAFDDSIWHF